MDVGARTKTHFFQSTIFALMSGALGWSGSFWSSQLASSSVEYPLYEQTVVMVTGSSVTSHLDLE